MKTVKKALKMLDSFTRDTQNQGVTEIASKCCLPKSTTHALLTTLKEEGYVIKDAKSRKYFLGFKFLELAGRVIYNYDLKDLSFPIMQELSKTSDEDVALNILAEGKRICIALVESRYFVRQFIPIGKSLPLHCSAAGKVLMAYLPRAEIDAIVKRCGLPKFMPNTITQKDRLLSELEDVKKKGYAESREEYGKDAAALGFPIFNTKEEVVASLSIQSTVNRLTKETKKMFIREGLLASKKISALVTQSLSLKGSG